MATYVNNLRLKEIATGAESGTWGTSTNTNLELIADAFGSGTEAITTNADTHTTTIADGSADEGRAIYMKYTGTLDSACTISLLPNTINKFWIIENATSGSQNIIISQGSGANITIGNGKVAAIFTDGAGSGAAVLDAFADLELSTTLTVGTDLDVDGTTNLDAVDIDGAVQIDSTVTVGVDDTGYDVKFFGDTASAYMLWDTSTDDLVLAGAAGIDLAGDLDVDGTANLDIVDIDGAVDMASTLGVTGVVTANAGVVVDNITIDGTEIDLSSGDLTIDVAGNLYLDADGAYVYLQDATTSVGLFKLSSSDFYMKSVVSDKDIIFQGNDGGVGITALTLDMSDAGTATFNNNLNIAATKKLYLDGGGNTYVTEAGADNVKWYVGGTELVTTNTTGTGVKMNGASVASLLHLGSCGDNRHITFAQSNTSGQVGYIHGIGSVSHADTTNSRITLFLSDGTTDGATTECFSFWRSGDIRMPATGKLYLDGGSNTYIAESAGDTMSFYTGGNLRLQINAGSVEVAAGYDLRVHPTERIYLDGGGDTFIEEASANNFKAFAAGIEGMCINDGGTIFNQGNNIAMDFIVEGQLNANMINVDATNRGRIGIGSAPDANSWCYVAGEIIADYWSGGNNQGFYVDTHVHVSPGDEAYVFRAKGDITLAGSGTTALFATAYFQQPTVTDGGGSTVTNTATVYIKDASSEGTNDYALWVDDGAVQFDSSLAVGGALSKGSGSFKIDHPLPKKKDTHHLVHSFHEGPRADLSYRGEVALESGSATVNLDDSAGMTEGTWELLCRDPQCWIQNDSGWDAVRGSVEGNTLTIECAEASSDDTVSWMVVAERCDPHIIETGWTDDSGRVIVEPEKVDG